MASRLTKRDGFWHYKRRVPADLAHLDPRGIVRHSTKIRVADDLRRQSLPTHRGFRAVICGAFTLHRVLRAQRQVSLCSVRMSWRSVRFAQCRAARGLKMTEEDPRAYLSTDARIIAENDTHAVIAIRVEKCWLDRNIHFFAALSSLACHTRSRVKVRHAIKSRRLQSRKRRSETIFAHDLGGLFA